MLNLGNEDKAPNPILGTGDKDSIISQKSLMAEQRKDPSLAFYYNQVLSEEDAKKETSCFVIRNNVLLRKWRPKDIPAGETWNEVYQILVPQKYTLDIMSVGHENPVAGHLGINKI